MCILHNGCKEKKKRGEERRKGTALVTAAAATSTSTLVMVTIIGVLIVVAYGGYKSTLNLRGKKFTVERERFFPLCSYCIELIDAI